MVSASPIDAQWLQSASQQLSCLRKVIVVADTANAMTQDMGRAVAIMCGRCTQVKSLSLEEVSLTTVGTSNLKCFMHLTQLIMQDCACSTFLAHLPDDGLASMVILQVSGSELSDLALVTSLELLANFGHVLLAPRICGLNVQLRDDLVQHWLNRVRSTDMWCLQFGIASGAMVDTICDFNVSITKIEF